MNLPASPETFFVIVFVLVITRLFEGFLTAAGQDVWMWLRGQLRRRQQ
jgi:hypothetical protein